MATFPQSISPAESPVRSPSGAIPGVANLDQPAVGRVAVPNVPEPPKSQGFGTLEEATKQIAQAVDKIQTRGDTVERAKAISAFDDAANTEFRRIQTEADLSDEKTFEGYRGFVNKTMQGLVDAHGGRADSKAALFSRLSGARDQFIDHAGRATLDAQVKKVDSVVGQFLNKRVAEVAQDPTQLQNSLARYRADLTEMGPALPVGREDQLLQHGQGEIAVSAISSLIDRRAIDQAETVMRTTPGLAAMIGPEAQRSLTSRIITQRAAIEKEQRLGLVKINEAEQILGRPLSATERIKLAGVAPPEGRQTLSSKISELETSIGRPLNEEEISKLAGARLPEDRPFGAGITGRSLEIINDLAPSFGAGITTEAQDRQFSSAVTQYTQPIQYQNPDTGLLETRRPQLPSFATEALRRRGIEPPQTEPRTGLPGGQSGTGQPIAAEPAGSPAPTGKSIWDLSRLATGPLPAAAELAGRTPLLGEFVQAPQMTQARNFIPIVQNNLVRVLQNNPRYAEGERTAIKEEISIEPAVFDTPSAFRNRLIAIDDALQVREQTAFKTAQSNMVGREERVQAMNILNGLIMFRQNLRVPVRVKNVADWAKVPAGNEYIDPDGNVKTKRAEQGQAP